MKGKDIVYTAEEYNQDELIPPQWLTKEYLKEFLQKHHDDDSVQILNYHISPASKRGDHYASIMFRIEMEYKTKDGRDKEISIILKTLPDEDCAKKEMLQESYVFNTEINMYENTLPKFEAVLKEHGDNTVLGAKILFSSLEPRKVIIFEDLSTAGYASIGIRLATMEEIKLALIKLAKWHAVSYKLKSEGDETISDYREGVFNMPNVENMEIFTEGIVHFINMLKKDPELQQYVPKFEKLKKKNILKQCVGIYNLGRGYRDDSSSGIYVLNHGDFHAKNLMFSYSASGNLNDVMLIDLQLCVWGPAIIDIIYAIFTLLNPQSRINHREELIYFYFTHFVDTLKLIKCKGPLPKLTDLHIDMIKYRYMEINMLISFLPFMYGFTSEEYMKGKDSASAFESPEARGNFYNIPAFIEEVKILLPQLLHKGYLDAE